ncbi:MAG: hypothetical protein JWQ73_2920 [Variovorax sp.]|nr:hypothetical protein [Variovorax sp.]
MKRRAFTAFSASSALSALAGGGLLTSSFKALAKDYPDHPLTFVVAYTPGSANDILVRIIAPALGRELGQAIVVENRPGAGGTLGGAQVAKAAPDGYTLGLGSTATVAINRALFKGLSYDPWKSFAPVIPFGTTPNVLVASPASGITSIASLKAAAGARPLNYSSSGNGTTQHLAGVLLQQTLGLRTTEHVPFKGPAEQVAAIAGNQVDFGFVSLPSGQALIRDGRLRALGVTSTRPAASLPQVPTLAAAGLKGFEQTGVWFGLVVAAGSPTSVIQRLHGAAARALAEPDLQKRLTDAGYELSSPSSPAEFSAFVEEQVGFWQQLVTSSGAVVG